MTAPRPSWPMCLAVCLCGEGLLGAETGPPSMSIELPIELRQGSLMVKACINGSEPLNLKVDTGFGITTLHPSLVERLELKRAGSLTIVGIAGNEEAATYGNAKFDFGGVQYSPRRVAVLPSDGSRGRRNRDGILGAGFFRRFVVEIDPQALKMRLHDPGKYSYTGKGEVIPLTFKTDTPIIDAALQPPGRVFVTGRFEIDTGCSGALCLGNDFCSANQLFDDADKTRMNVRSGVGGGVQTRPGQFAALKLGDLQVEKPSANLFLKGSPAGEGQAGHIGMGALRHFKVIFDYSRKRMILEPIQQP